MTFTEAELAYFKGQRLGRLATAAPDGTLQNNPVGFTVDAGNGTIDIGGWKMGESRKFHNVLKNPEVAFVIDDIASLNPWTVRGVEIRGRAEAITGIDRAPGDYMSPEVIRIHPRRILTWGLDDQPEDKRRRTIEP